MIGTIVDHYKIISRIAGGGMGEVYKAIDLELEREVAIKCVRPELSELEEATKRFRAEARTLARLSHLNIATVYRFFADEDRLYLVMEYIDGKPFGELITNDGSLAPDQAVTLVRDALTGLGYAHRHKIVHRDIKPGNLMVDQENTVKVLDFGIAHLIGGTRLTRVGSAVGTPAYMSPEQVLGKDIDPRTDIYAIGVVLYEMLSGKLPYTANSDFELMRAHLEEVPRPLSELAKNDVPQALQDTVERALAKDTNDRFQSAEEFVEALDDAEKGRSSARTAVVPPPTPPPQAPTLPNEPPATDSIAPLQKYRSALIGGACAIVIVVLAALFWPRAPSVEPSDRSVSATLPTAPSTSQTITSADQGQNLRPKQDPNQGQVQGTTAAATALSQTTQASPGEGLPAQNLTQPSPSAATAGSNIVASPTSSPAPQVKQPAAAIQQPIAAPTRPKPAAPAPSAKVAVVKVSVHENQGTGRFSRDAGYNGAFRLSVPRNASRNLEISEVAEVYRDGELVREQTVTSEMRTPGTFKSKQRIQGLKTLDPGEYQIRLLFVSDGKTLGSHQWNLLVSG